MTTQQHVFETQPRTVLRKKLGALRRSGITPVHLYGKSIQPMTLQADSQNVRRLIATVGPNTPVYVTVAGSPDRHFAFIREIQRHPVSERILHVDFYEVPLTETMEAEVPIRLVGEAPAVRLLKGNLLHALQSITVESLPLDIPQQVEVDVSRLINFDVSVTVADIKVSDKVKILTPLDEMVARVTPPRAEEVVEGAAASTAAEPEVVTARKAAEEAAEA